MLSKWGSILLGELAVILITLEYMTCSFSDSQPAVGMLTLNWKDTSYKPITRGIRTATNILQQAGTIADINWVPVHRSIAGNEGADRLAKEAAKKANRLPEGNSSTTTADVSVGSDTDTMTLWQHRRDTTEVGRVFHRHNLSMRSIRPFDQPSKESYIMILQLQIGYSPLNDYMSKLGQVESNLCQCGQVEDTEHYLLQCPLQKIPCNIMTRKLGLTVGLYHLDIQDLL